MNILYIANVRMPTEKAHGLQIMKTCEAFADLGHRVTLTVPRRRNTIKDDPFAYYAVRKNFEIRKVFSLDLIRWGKAGFLVQYATFSIAAALSKSVRSADLIYGRDELSLLFVSPFARAPIVWESHVGAWNGAARHVARRARAIVTISGGLKEFYSSKGVPASDIIVAPDGVDLEDFSHPESKEAARRRLGLPIDGKIALYIGRLDGWKGVDTLCETAQYLSPDIWVAVIGGEPEQVAAFKRKYPTVIFLGYRPYRELANNQSAGDMLVLPNTARDEISARFTSPLKLFTYMASGIPIVASDLPSIREVLDDRSAVFFKPDEPHSLANTISILAADPVQGENLARRARETVERYTWRERAQMILLVVRV